MMTQIKYTISVIVGAYTEERWQNLVEAVESVQRQTGRTSCWLWREGEMTRLTLTWLQVAYIHQTGIECGGHIFHHPQLDLLPIAEAHDEIVSCKDEQQFVSPVHSTGKCPECSTVFALKLAQLPRIVHSHRLIA